MGDALTSPKSLEKLNNLIKFTFEEPLPESNL
jgi:hypothetical protein